MNPAPAEFYGIVQRNTSVSHIDQTVEQIRNLGFAIFDPELSDEELEVISEDFDITRERYVNSHGASRLREINEIHTIRSPLTHGGNTFLRLALNEKLLSLLKILISGKFILNQQNGIINPPPRTTIKVPGTEIFHTSILCHRVR